MELKDKVPPHDMDAEQATLGAMLLDWKCVSEIVAYLRSDYFYDLRNQVIFSSLVNLSNRITKGDLITTGNHLTPKKFDSINNDCNEIIYILIAIVKKTKENGF